jgi:hypothetical protein
VSQEHRLVAVAADVQGGAVGRVRHVDRQPEPVHPRHRSPAEGGQAAVAGLGKAAAQGVGVGVRDPDLPDAKAVEHVEAVDLVLDRGGRFQPEHQPHPPGPMRLVDIGHCADDHDLPLLGEVGLAHPQVGDDVVPPPRAFPVTQAVPFIMLSNTTVMPDAARPA